MKHVVRLLGTACLCLLLGLLLPGCQRDKHRVTGKVTRAGKPLQWKTANHHLLVLFVPFDRQSDRRVYRAESDTEAGTFAVTVPAGKYRISLQQMDPVPTHDLLEFTYSIKASPIIRDVDQPGAIDIDLPQELPNGGGGGG